jgi:hypothetical protein
MARVAKAFVTLGNHVQVTGPSDIAWIRKTSAGRDWAGYAVAEDDRATK